MSFDKVNKVIMERYKVIISRAAQIVNMTKGASDSGDFNADLLNAIDACRDDIDTELQCLYNLLDALGLDKGKE